MSASQGAWECRHGVEGRDWCDECHSSASNAMDALIVCRRAWESTQPQLFWTDENLWGLDEPGPGAARLVEPSHSGLEGGDVGCSRARSNVVSLEPAHLTGSPQGGLDTFKGEGANHIQVARLPQKGA